MRQRGLSVGGWLAGWIVSPAVAFGAMTGLGGFIWAALAGLPAVVVALIALAGLTLGVVLAHHALVLRDRVRRRDEAAKKPHMLGPDERREALDNLFYPPADPRRELGERCANFAIRMSVFNEEMEARREHATARYAHEIREADPSLDPFQVREDAEAHFERQVEAAYGSEMREQALKLFDEAREREAIAEKVRRVADSPLAVELGDVPNLFLAIARRLGDKPITHPWPPSNPLPSGLPVELDDLMREGIGLVDELSVSAKPEKTNDGNWKLEGGDAPDEWWEKADDFQKRIRNLLIQHHPALLTDFRDGFNAHLKKEREEKPNPARDTRSTGEKMLALANFERSGPKRIVVASLDGLAAARHRLGGQQEAA
jgi:heme exporter protein D